MNTYRTAEQRPGAGPLPMIERVEDGAFIPQDPENADYQAYLAWVAGGNVADIIPTVSAPPTPTVVRQQSPDGTWWEQRVNNAGQTQWARVDPAPDSVTPPQQAARRT